MQVTIKQRAAVAPCAQSQMIFIDTLSLFEWLTYLDKVPMSFMLAIHTGGFICYQCELRTIDYREETTQAIKCSIIWFKKSYQHTTCWVCDHATCCVLLCFTLQHRITLLFCLTGASGESKQNQICVSHLLLSDFQCKTDTWQPCTTGCILLQSQDFIQLLWKALLLNGLNFFMPSELLKGLFVTEKKSYGSNQLWFPIRKVDRSPVPLLLSKQFLLRKTSPIRIPCLM